MTEKEFIEKAISGGWAFKDKKPEYSEIWGTFFVEHSDDDYEYISIQQVLLDMRVWEAVGKVEGWDKRITFSTYQKVHGSDWVAVMSEKPEWQLTVHQMIDHLIEEGTITSYLETLDINCLSNTDEAKDYEQRALDTSEGS